ncbi:MAG: putative sugar nucleotidyl transferase [Chitinophagaceae bacterium]
MTRIVFTEAGSNPGDLFPFTLTRKAQDIRLGIFTIRQKWEHHLGLTSFDNSGEHKTKPEHLLPEGLPGKEMIYLIRGNSLPSKNMASQVKKLRPGEALSLPDETPFLHYLSVEQLRNGAGLSAKKVPIIEEVKVLQFPWEIFAMNKWALEQDFSFVRKKRKSNSISRTNKVVNEKNVFLEKGCSVEHCLINATEGPVYIGKNALVMEGTMLRGPVSIGEGAVVKMGARIYGATTVGPFCTVGGEIKNSVIFAYSNKAHDGYLGDSVLGEWCNLGAGTSNSNIKNSASDIKVHTPSGNKLVGTKCGLLMGDYSRSAINTSFNTGTVVGTCSNVFGTGLSPNYIPSFSWGSDGARYNYDKAIKHVKNWKALKQQTLTAHDASVLESIYNYH